MNKCNDEICCEGRSGSTLTEGQEIFFFVVIANGFIFRRCTCEVHVIAPLTSVFDCRLFTTINDMSTDLRSAKDVQEGEEFPSRRTNPSLFAVLVCILPCDPDW